jgi:hypothetical protein
MQCELTRELRYLEGFLNKTLDNEASLEISVGQCFSNYARNVLHIPDTERRKYDHVCPNGYRRKAWAYPIGYLSDFRQWLYEVYFPEKYVIYRNNHAKRLGFQRPRIAAQNQRIAQKRIAQSARYDVEQLPLFSKEEEER